MTTEQTKTCAICKRAFEPTGRNQKYCPKCGKMRRERSSAIAKRRSEEREREKNQNDRMFMACLMFTGMRPGEIYGLRWEDVSPDEGIIHIRRAIAFCKNKAIIGDTKTKAGVRSIPLSPRLLKFLEPCGEEGFIINREGEPYTEQAHKRAWERIKRTIDVHGMTPYIGRHTYLTALNREGVDLKTIQAIAGHEDERMALRTYIHCDETLVNNAGKAMEARFERMTAM